MAFEELASELTLDASGYVSSAEEAADATEGFGESAEDAAGSAGLLEDVDFEGVAAGLGAAGVGGAAQEALDNTQPLREELGRTAEAVEPAKDELQDLVTALSNETFSQDDATATLSNLAELGVESEDELSDLAATSDTLADATGTTAEQVSGELLPSLRAMGEDPGDLEEHMDTLAFLSNETSLSMDDFSRIVRKNADEMRDLGLGVDDTAGILTKLEERGLDSRTAIREFRQAANDAEGDQQALLESLDISSESFEQQTEAIQNSETSAQDYASAANESFSESDRLGAIVDDLQLKFSSVLEPISAAAPVLTGVGAAMAGVSAINVGALIPSFATLMTTILPIIVAVGALTAAGVIVAELFGDDILAAVEDLTDGLGDLLGPAEDLAEDVFDALADAGEAVGDVISDLIDGVAELAAPIRRRLNPAIDEVAKTVDVWGDVVGDVAGALADALTPAVNTAGDAAAALAGTVGDVLEPVVSALADVLKATLLTAVEAVSDAIEALAQLLRGDVEGAFNSVIDLVTNLGDKIKNGLQSAANAATEIASDFADAGAELGSKLVDALVDGVTGAPGTLKDGLTSLISSAVPAAAAVKNALSGLGSRLVSGIGGLLSDAGNFGSALGQKISDSIPSLADVKDALTDVGSDALGLGSRLITGIGELLSDAGGFASDITGKISDSIPSLSDIKDSVTGIGSNLVSAIGDKITDAPGTIKSAIKSVINSAIDSINSLVPGVSATIPSNDVGLPGPLPSVDEGTIVDSTIIPDDPFPKLASGGFVEESGAAVIHEGEQVVPAADVDKGSGGAGVTVNIETVNASSRREGREAGRALKRELRGLDL